MDDFTGVIESAMSGDAAPADAAAPPAADPVEQPDASASDADSAALAPEAAPTGVPVTAAEPIEGQAVPYARFKEVNERAKSVEAQYAWAKEIQPADAPHIAEFYRRFQQNGVATLIQEIEGLAQSDPAVAQAARSAAARWMGRGRGQAPAEEPMPEADLQTPDGVLVYSHEQQQKLLDWRDRRTEARFAKTMQPLQQWAQQIQQTQARSEMQTKANTWAQQTFNEWSAKPHFLDNKQAIGELMRDKGLGLADAYVEILTTRVLPGLQAKERSAVVTAMQDKAAAGSPNPGRQPAQGLKRPTKFGEAIRQNLGLAT